MDCVGLGQKFSTFNESGWDGSNCKKCVKVYQYNFYCIPALFASICRVWFCWFQNSLHVPCRRVPTYTASMTISKTKRSRVRNIYRNAVTLARHTFMGRHSHARIFTGTAFPCVPAPLHPWMDLGPTLINGFLG